MTRWLHKKRGTTYTEIGRGTLQMGKIDHLSMVIYRADSDGTLWVRPVEEFEDGRFMLLNETGEGMFNLYQHLVEQKRWSENTFGPGDRSKGIIDHISKELDELRASPQDLEEWIDVIILALDAAWRIGASPSQIIGMLKHKTAKNHARKWPDWKTFSNDVAIEHLRDAPASTFADGEEK